MDLRYLGGRFNGRCLNMGNNGERKVKNRTPRFHGCNPWGDKVISEIKEPWRRVDLGDEGMGSVG